MKHRHALVFLLALVACLPVWAKTYDSLWKQVTEFDRKALPQSALRVTQEIYEKALEEGDTPQLLKAYLVGMRYREEVVPDSFYLDVRGLEEWLERATQPVDRAVLHLMLAEGYASMRGGSVSDASLVDEDDLPADLRMWSRCDYERTAFRHYSRVLEQPDALASVSMQAYAPLLEKGNVGPYYADDLLHVLGQMVLDGFAGLYSLDGYFPQTPRMESPDYTLADGVSGRTLEPASAYDCVAAVLDTYRLLLAHYRSAGNREAQLLLDLSRLQFIYGHLRDFSRNSDEVSYYAALERLRAIYADLPLSVEVILEMVQWKQRHNASGDALVLIREAVRKYPRYSRIGELKNLEDVILRPECHVFCSNEAYPGSRLQLSIRHRNLEHVRLELFRVALPADSPLLLDNSDLRLGKKLLTSVTAHDIGLMPPADYQLQDTVVSVSVPEEGVYQLELSAEGKDMEDCRSFLYVSRLSVLSLSLPDNQTEFTVVDRRTGHPVPYAEILFYENEYNKRSVLRKRLETGADGSVTTSESGRCWLRAVKGDDQAMRPSWLYNNVYNAATNRQAAHDVWQLYTDRSIYRPGQSVQVGGLAYRQEGDSTCVLTDKDCLVELYDANNRKLAEKQVTTNAYGTFSTEFALPVSCLPGRFSLRGADVWQSFRVEEYKRPTFDVVLDPLSGAYVEGDSVWVEGRAQTFSGIAVADAVVAYDVRSSSAYWWRAQIRQTASGQVRTDADGRFRFRICLEKDEDVARSLCWYRHFMVDVAVTDVAGETQTGSTRLAIGSSAYRISARMPEELVKEQTDSLTVLVSNLSDQPVQVQGRYTISRLVGEIVSGSWVESGQQEAVLEGTFTSNTPMDLARWKLLPSGRYRLELAVADSLGREAREKHDFALFSMSDRKIPGKAVAWLYVPEKTFAPGRDATLLMGTSEQDVYVFYDVFSGNQRIDTRRFHLSDSLMTFVYPYREVYGDGLSVRFTLMREGRLHEHEVQIEKVRPEKDLQLSWTSFRNCLRPGQQEEWTLSVRTPDGKPADAELMAVLYDASLDKLQMHDWSMNLGFYRRFPYYGWAWMRIARGFLFTGALLRPVDVPALIHDRMPLPELGWSARVSLYDAVFCCVEESGSPVLSRAAGSVKTGAMKKSYANDMQVDAVFESEAVPINVQEEQKQEQEDDSAEMQLQQGAESRTNFAETAFFYPQLRTDTTGAVRIAFVLPESLTEWKFMGLAHTKDLCWKRMTDKVVARKEFMVSPNLPRFVRVGDQVVLAAKITNLTDKRLKGIARMQLFDPITEKVFLSKKVSFVAEVGQTSVARFAFQVNLKPGVVACRITAESGHFSDGEQHYLPVLTDKEWITETMPITLVDDGESTYPLAGLFNQDSPTATDRRLVVECSGNPVWYAVQALPSLGCPSNENAVSWATAYYANGVAAFIMRSNPQIKDWLDAWQADGASQETFVSRLENNQELKSILLEETPWVSEASDEEERVRRLALLFDLNRQYYQQHAMVDKLRDLQLSDGAWPWYKGMSGSRYVTQYVVELLTRLSELTGQPLPDDVRPLYDKALDYLHGEVRKEYRSLRKRKETTDVYPSELTVHYLYVCSRMHPELTAESREANRYFLERLKQANRALTVYGKALSAIVLHREGYASEAADLIRSLKEYAVDVPDKGMYYDTRRSAYAWSSYRVPTQVAAIEAMDIVAHDTVAVERLKLWLLLQKRVQEWDSPLATADAVHALLLRGTNLFGHRNRVTFTLGKRVTDTASDEKLMPGSGYVKEVLEGKDIPSGREHMKVNKTGGGLAWGAVYAQCLEELDRVQATGSSELSVEKRLYVERRNDDGRTMLVAVQDGERVGVGDKVVVRLMLVVGQDMDFVQLKDERAACLEPATLRSGYCWGGASFPGHYVAVKDVTTNYFFDKLSKGTYVLETAYYVAREGEYSSGIARLQSAYAPEYAAHSDSMRIKVTEK